MSDNRPTLLQPAEPPCDEVDLPHEGLDVYRRAGVLGGVLGTLFVIFVTWANDEKDEQRPLPSACGVAQIPGHASS